jgi:hypothetical protein
MVAAGHDTVSTSTLMEDAMFRSLLTAGAGAALLIGCASVSLAQQPKGDEKLMIVNGNNHHVIYDDGRDDLFCVTRRIVVGYTDSGRPIFRRTMHCR